MEASTAAGANQDHASTAIELEDKRRKRLSRKEQKERKKQKKQHPQHSEEQSQPIYVTTPSDEATTPSKTTKKKKKKKYKKNERAESQVKPTPEQQSGQSSLSSSPALMKEQEPYKAISVPTFQELEQSHGSSKKSLGKWFPKAVIVKSKEPPIQGTDKKACLALFYQYVNPHWPESVTQQLVAYLLKICKERVLGGRVRVAREGINATLSSIDSDTCTAATTLQHVTKDLQSFHKIFCETDFKFIENLSGDRHFKDFKVFPVKELVFYGLDEEQAPLHKGGTHLSAQEFHEKLEEDDAVVVDVRNSYEAAIGRFDGQTVTNTTQDETKDEKAKGAAYVDPRMRKSTDFAHWLQKPETKSQLQGKKVLLYCTGGVRCERASAYLNHSMGDKVQGVYQLQGGIERYLQAFPTGGHWRGKNFVFDKREAFGVENPDGDGGVVDKKKTKNAETTFLPEMKCCVCSEPWDRYVGKKKCETCGVPILMCDSCMASNKKTHVDKKSLLIRCPLCVEENISVRAEDVDWTNNGVKTVRASISEENTNDSTGNQKQKAAASVLKWGGGHASEKKRLRKFKRKPCKFGADCVRPECFFAHPDRESASSAKH